MRVWVDGSAVWLCLAASRTPLVQGLVPAKARHNAGASARLALRALMLRRGCAVLDAWPSARVMLGACRPTHPHAHAPARPHTHAPTATARRPGPMIIACCSLLSRSAVGYVVLLTVC